MAHAEGPYVGYRGHDAGLAPEPVFWLGDGLWEYPDARLVTGDSPAVTVTVRNAGARPSREVVQVYVRPAEVDQPVRLAGWEPVTGAPGRSARITVATDRRMWRTWNTEAARWDRLGPGGEFLIARGLGDIRAVLPVK